MSAVCLPAIVAPGKTNYASLIVLLVAPFSLIARLPWHRTRADSCHWYDACSIWTFPLKISISSFTLLAKYQTKADTPFYFSTATHKILPIDMLALETDLMIYINFRTIVWFIRAILLGTLRCIKIVNTRCVGKAFDWSNANNHRCTSINRKSSCFYHAWLEYLVLTNFLSFSIPYSAYSTNGKNQCTLVATEAHASLRPTWHNIIIISRKRKLNKFERRKEQFKIIFTSSRE